jgi:hypothetical protein
MDPATLNAALAIHLKWGPERMTPIKERLKKKCPGLNKVRHWPNCDAAARGRNGPSATATSTTIPPARRTNCAAACEQPIRGCRPENMTSIYSHGNLLRGERDGLAAEDAPVASAPHTRYQARPARGRVLTTSIRARSNHNPEADPPQQLALGTTLRSPRSSATRPPPSGRRCLKEDLDFGEPGRLRRVYASDGMLIHDPLQLQATLGLFRCRSSRKSSDSDTRPMRFLPSDIAFEEAVIAASKDAAHQWCARW